MKITCHEFDLEFFIELSPESVAEAAFLCRFNQNIRRKPVSKGLTARRDGSFNGWISWRKRIDFKSSIERGG